MGVDTTSGDCNTPQQSCHDDIKGSWCSWGIPCNKEIRGDAVYCNYGSALKMGLGKCHCKPGFCPVNGKCVAKKDVEAAYWSMSLSISSVHKNKISAAILGENSPSTIEQSKNGQASPLQFPRLDVLVPAFVACGLLAFLSIRTCSRSR